MVTVELISKVPISKTVTEIVTDRHRVQKNTGNKKGESANYLIRLSFCW